MPKTAPATPGFLRFLEGSLRSAPDWRTDETGSHSTPPPATSCDASRACVPTPVHGTMLTPADSAVVVAAECLKARPHTGLARVTTPCHVETSSSSSC